MEAEKHALTPNEIGDCLGGMTVQGVYKLLKTHNIQAFHTNSNRKLIPPIGVRKIFEERGFKYPNTNISFQIVKGGVGKTSLSFSLAIRACHYGAKVLAIDLDQQGNLTRSFDVEARNTPVWLDIIRDPAKIDHAIIKVLGNLHVIPSNLNNSRLDVELTQTAVNLKDMIRDSLSSIRGEYDIVIIDCPPAINKINTAATCASDMIIIPINPDPYAMDGLEFTLAELTKIRKDFKLAFDHRILWNRFDARERLGAFFMHDLAKNEDRFNHVLPVVIRTDATLRNAVFKSKSVFEMPKKTTKATIREDIDQFTREILGINSWKESNQAK